MEITSAKFVSSFVDLEKLPRPDKPEFAFIGRSNVGKSSLINMLAGNKSLAKTSSTPGKTQTINHFIINSDWYLVDLPGYGYAKTARTERGKWKNFSEKYFLQRENLVGVCVLIDSRIPPQQNDLEFMEWLTLNSVPFVIVFTKIDKLTKNEFAKNMAKYKTGMLEFWEEMPVTFYTSAEKGTGKEELLKFIEKANKSFKKKKFYP
jgi:GTP-binding protein